MSKKSSLSTVIIRDTAPENFLLAARAAKKFIEEHPKDKHLVLVYGDDDDFTAFCWRNVTSYTVRIEAKKKNSE